MRLQKNSDRTESTMLPNRLKYGAILAVFISWTVFVYLRSASIQRSYDANVAYELEVKNDRVIVDTIQRLNQKAMESMELSNKIGVIGNEKQSEIDDLERTNRKLFADGRVRRQVCTNSNKSVSEDTHTGSIKNEATLTTTLSKEFVEFLNHLTRRADETGVYGEIAFEWLQELDKDGDGFICD